MPAVFSALARSASVSKISWTVSAISSLLRRLEWRIYLPRASGASVAVRRPAEQYGRTGRRLERRDGCDVGGAGLRPAGSDGPVVWGPVGFGGAWISI